MLKDDYIMNIINQITRLLGKILTDVDDGQYEEAQEMIDESLEEFVGLSSSQLESLSAEAIVYFLSDKEMGGAGEILMVTELMLVEATICDAEEDEVGAYQRRLKVLTIRLYLALGRGLINAQLDQTIDNVVASLSDYELPIETMLTLLHYYEKTTRFDLAQQILDDLMEHYPAHRSEVVEEGLTFYERLMRLSLTELQAGNLTPQQLTEGFDDLWRRQ